MNDCITAYYAVGEELAVAMAVTANPKLRFHSDVVTHIAPQQLAARLARGVSCGLMQTGQVIGVAHFAVDMRPSSGLWRMDIGLPEDADVQLWKTAMQVSVEELARWHPVCKVFQRFSQDQSVRSAAAEAAGWSAEGYLRGYFMVSGQRRDALQFGLDLLGREQSN